MAIQVKTFRLNQGEGEQEINSFLNNKNVRHWNASYQPDGASGAWNVFIAYEERTMEDGNGAMNDRQRRQNPMDRKRPNEVLRPRRVNEPNPERPPRQEFVPQLDAQDMTLYEGIRKWRNNLARELDIRPFRIISNSQIEQIAKTKPTGEEELRTLVPEMSPEHWEKHKGELLGFISGANHESAVSLTN